MSSALSAQVTLLWGDNPLRVDRVAAPRAYWLGEHQAGEAPCDCPLPRELVGARRARLLTTKGGRVQLLGGIDLVPGAVARVTLPGSALALEVRAGPGERLPGGRGLPFDAAAILTTAASAAFHVALLAALALLFPAARFDDAEAGAAKVARIRDLLGAAGENGGGDVDPGLRGGGAEAPRPGRPYTGTDLDRTMGAELAPRVAARYAVLGAPDNADPHIARQSALREALTFGMIDLVATGADLAGAFAPHAAWGREDAEGVDRSSARGDMWGDAIGDAFGVGGLGLSGFGEGSGGHGDGVGIGGIGTIGRGSGSASGPGNAFGRGFGLAAQGHTTRAPVLRCGSAEDEPPSRGCNAQVNGRLPPESIQRVVRQNFGRFRLCYEEGLRTQPNLSARVSVKFVIGRDGAVTTAMDNGSDLPDARVVSCIVRRFGELSFPEPEGGIVTVVYPIVLSPGG